MAKKLLLFAKDTAAFSGWSDFGEFEDRRLKELEKDNITNGRGGVNPKVSIPSPFARFELVQSAFRNVTDLKNPEVRDKRLVFYSLDVAQLFFENQSGLTISKWDIKENLSNLAKSNIKGQKSLSKVLELYMDKENYGFDKLDSIYTISYQKKLIGCTSPTSLFMCTPNFEDVINSNKSIQLQGNAKLFNNQQHLHQRDKKFIKYFYVTLSKLIHYMLDKELWKSFSESSLNEIIRYAEKERENHELIEDMIPSNWKDRDSDFYNSDEYLDSAEGVNLFGCVFGQIPTGGAQKQIQSDSGFVVDTNKSSKKPLILTNVNGAYSGWNYISKGMSWDYCIKNENITLKADRTKLPMKDGAEVHYDDMWKCEDDFLDDVIIRLPYPLNTTNFFDGNLERQTTNNNQKKEYYYYLPPIKKDFFEFFDYSYLNESIGNEKNFKLVEYDDKVKAILRIKTKGGYVRLEKEYHLPNSDQSDLVSILDYKHTSGQLYEAKGLIMECPLSVSIMPFVRHNESALNHYSIQYAITKENLGEYEVALNAYKTDDSNDIEVTMSSYQRSENTSYHTVDEALDYFILDISKGKRKHNATIIPNLRDIKSQKDGMDFAFDFGTTNSYIAVKNENKISDIDLSNAIGTMIDFENSEIQQDYSEDLFAIELLQSYMLQEFIPNSFGLEYKFPHRTVLSFPKKFDKNLSNISSLQHANIPFVYGKSDYGSENNYVETGFKWDKNEHLSYLFFDEMARIAYAYAVSQGANLKECKFVWTYPLAMEGQYVTKYRKRWVELFKKYFDNSYDEENDEDHLIVSHMTESIAPFIKYCEINKVAPSDMALSIDIGGGTSDVVIYYDDDDDDEDKLPAYLTSFRFAADSVFGAGSKYARDNRMIQKYYQRFNAKLNSLNADIKVTTLLSKFCGDKSEEKPSDANSIFFSLEDNPSLGKDVSLSYNNLLSDDDEFKIIFVYFYGAMIYYLTDLLRTYGYPKPDKVLFSGTGSKLLNIIADNSLLKYLTTRFLDEFSNGNYTYKKDVDIFKEKDRPKQTTAEGALSEPSRTFKKVAKYFTNLNRNAQLERVKIYYSMLPNEENTSAGRGLKYGDMLNTDNISYISTKVKDFHDKFFRLLNDNDLGITTDYGCSKESIDLLRSIADLDIDDINKKLKNGFFDVHDREECRENREKECEDSAVFFYPIKSIINEFFVRR